MKRSILIRFDDICPTMNWAEWERADEVMRKYNVKPLIGVIPDSQDPDLMIDSPRADFWDFIKELQRDGYTVAMHGYHHVFDSNVRGIVNTSAKSEYAGNSYQEQFEKIKNGKKQLLSHGIETNIFFAPAHSYDENTLKALAANGFKYVSDGKSRKPFYRHGILCIPCRSGGCPKIGKGGCYTAVFHAHEWVRPDKKKGFEDLVRLCEKYTNDIVTFDEYAEQNIGSPVIQLWDEKLYMFFENELKPVLRPFVKRVKAMISKRYVHKIQVDK